MLGHETSESFLRNHRPSQQEQKKNIVEQKKKLYFYHQPTTMPDRKMFHPNWAELILIIGIVHFSYFFFVHSYICIPAYIYKWNWIIWFASLFFLLFILYSLFYSVTATPIESIVWIPRNGNKRLEIRRWEIEYIVLYIILLLFIL